MTGMHEDTETGSDYSSDNVSTIMFLPGGQLKEQPDKAVQPDDRFQ